MRRGFVLDSARTNKDYIHENTGLLEKAEDRNLNCIHYKCFSTSVLFPCIPEVWTFLQYKLSSITTLPACQKSTFTGLAGQPVQVSRENHVLFAG